MYSNISLKGKVAIVTGASSGIGLEITKMLIDEGCTVIMVSKTYEKLKKISEELNKKKKIAFPFQAETSSPIHILYPNAQGHTVPQPPEPPLLLFQVPDRWPKAPGRQRR